jgi:hypothetical protein
MIQYYRIVPYHTYTKINIGIKMHDFVINLIGGFFYGCMSFGSGGEDS